MLKKVNKENVITELEKTGRRYFGKYNKAFAIGKVIEEFEEVTSDDGKKVFYNSQISVERRNGITDNINITVPQELKEYDDYVDKVVQITGQFRSFIKDGHKRLFLYANTFDVYNEPIPEDSNLTYLEGYLTRKPYCKLSKKDKIKIAEFCVAVRRRDSVSPEDADYINCVAWGDNADFIQYTRPKKKVKMNGRLQSRLINGSEVYSFTVREFIM